MTSAADDLFDEGPLTAAELAEEIEAEGYSAAQARQMVSDYVADCTAQIGVDTSQWGLDRHDLTAILTAPTANHAADASVDPLERARAAVDDLDDADAAGLEDETSVYEPIHDDANYDVDDVAVWEAGA